MSKTSVRIWDFNAGTKRIQIYRNGTINRNAIRAFQSGQCHSLALAIHALVGWPIYGIIGQGNSETSPGHVVVKNPKNGAFVDINGTGALQRWRKRWGEINTIPIEPAKVYKFDAYLVPNVKAAVPFARKVLKQIGVKT